MIDERLRLITAVLAAGRWPEIEQAQLTHAVIPTPNKRGSSWLPTKPIPPPFGWIRWLNGEPLERGVHGRFPKRAARDVRRLPDRYPSPRLLARTRRCLA
ncbi:MAG: hypothetical protein M5U34_15425 [Chloroflexi bacterium]|nr:hypothetical protein [Chloroflexota bacterium]